MPRYLAALYATCLLLCGCESLPKVDTRAAEADAPSGSTPPMPRLLGDDEITRRTDRQLAAVGADNLDALKPGGHGAMPQEHGGAHGTQDMTGHGTGTSKTPMDHGTHSPSPAAQGGASSHQHH